MSALGALTGGVSGVAKAVNDVAAAKKQLDETKRHNLKMEQVKLGRGLYLKPHNAGKGLRLHNESIKKKKTSINLPERPLTDADIIKYAKILKIPHFRGVYMRNNLPGSGPRVQESAVVNLDDKDSRGTHWVAYRKNGSSAIYYDSFGNLRPPKDLMDYLRINKVKYNHERYQEFNTFICGHLCLLFLSKQLPKPIKN